MSGNPFSNWLATPFVAMEPVESLNYYADMYAAHAPSYRGAAPTAFSVQTAGQRRWDQALYATPPGFFHLLLLPEQQVAPPAFSAGQGQWNPAPYAASQQSAGPQMGPAQQVGAPTFIGNQQGRLAGPTNSVAGPQFMVPQAAPPASQAYWNPAPYAAPTQAGQNLTTARRVAPPAAAPRAFNAHRAPSAVPSYLVPRSWKAASQEPIDLTGNDDEAGPSTPAPQCARTKRARADSTSGAAGPSVKRAKKEPKPKVVRPKKEPKKKESKGITNSGLRIPVAATSAPSDNSSIPFQGETLAVQQQQQQLFSAPVATEPFYNAADTTANAPEMMRIDSADPIWESEQPAMEQRQQQQQQQDFSADVNADFSPKPIYTTSNLQEAKKEAAEAKRVIFGDYLTGNLADDRIILMDALNLGWRG